MTEQKYRYSSGTKYLVSLAGAVLLIAVGGFSGYVIRRLDATVTHRQLEQHSSVPHSGAATTEELIHNKDDFQEDVRRLEARQIRIEDKVDDIRQRLSGVDP